MSHEDTMKKERRWSPPVYKLLIAVHVGVSGAWLGVVIAKVVLGLAAASAAVPAVAVARYGALDVLNVAFPPLTVGTLLSGVLLSWGTKWGLLRHYWVATKLLLTVVVIATAGSFGDRLTAQAIAGVVGEAPAGEGFFAFPSTASALLLTLIVLHMVLLGAATVLSVYKPWGKTWVGRRAALRRTPQRPRGHDRRPAERPETPARLSPSR